MLLELDGASRLYDDGHPIHALRPTSLTIQSGDYIAITGPSGSGKSTLLNILGLLESPSNGSYRVGGIETRGAGERLRAAMRGQLFGFVFQAFHLLSGRTVLENIEIGMLYGPYRHRARQRRALSALERVGLADRVHSDPRSLSGGERQRVAVARAVADHPKFLFCDEPTGNLDSENTNNVLSLLRELNQSGLAIIVATHESQVAAEGSRRLAVLDGEVSEV